jgi:hypothetical protein
MTIDLDTNTTLPDFLNEVMLNRFPDDSIKQKIDFSNPKKINLACPVCGDSEKKKSKRRGNIYLESNTYKCYNDGCMVFMELDKFIAKYCHEYSLMPPDIFVKGGMKSQVKSRKKISLLNFLINEDLKNKLLDLEYFTYRFSLNKIGNDSECLKYIKNRKLDQCDSFSKCCYEDSKSKKIFIFNKDNVSDKILGYSVRSIDDNYWGPKYKMMNYSEINREVSKLGMSDDELNEIDSLNNVFNILNIDFKKKITICEGQFDSMFVYNCIASTGVGKINETISMLSNDTNVRILFDNDNAGKNQSIKLLQEGYEVFMWSRLIKDLKNDFPDHLLDIKKITDVNVLYMFLSKLNSSFFGIKEFNKTLDSYFTDSLFDILYL